MGRIEVTDGVSTRRIEAPELRGVVRVDLSGEPSVEVPDGLSVDRRGGADHDGVPAHRRTR